MQEDIEVKELRLCEFEHGKKSSKNLKTDSVEERIQFLVNLLQKLRNQNNNELTNMGARD